VLSHPVRCRSKAPHFFVFLYQPSTLKNPENYSAANPEKWKSIRDRIYRTCGVLTALSIFTILILMQIEKYMLITIGFKYTFWLEVTSIVPFGIAWLVKGGFLFTDQGKASTVEQAKNMLSNRKKLNKQTKNLIGIVYTKLHPNYSLS
jgi:hypothetical protein